MTPSVRAEGISKNFYDFTRGEVSVVKNLSFVCSPGEILGILGPNGAGKTTILRMVSALLAPTTGTINVAGFDTQKNPHEVRSRIGFISQDTNLYDRLTPMETVQIFGRFYGVPEEKLAARLEEIFRRLAMEKILDRQCRTLSTGEKQKTSIARTLIHDPPVLILDEATTGLDVLASRDILWMVREARASGKAILYSAHNMIEVENLCDRIILLHEGEVLEQGTVPEVVERTGMRNLTESFLHLVEARK